MWRVFLFGGTMRFAKPSLSIEQQAEQLISRGLTTSKEQLVTILADISYYRLSGYLFPHKQENSDNFKPNTRFSTVFDQYLFDRQLRVLVMDAIERVEVSVKTRMLNILVMKNGPFAHTNRAHFPGMSVEDHRKLLDKIHQSTDRSNCFGEQFIQHYIETYTSETEVPLWMVMEIIDFGAMFTIFRHLEQYDQREIASAYGVRAGVLEQWLKTLNYIRNICAHHGRLWNRGLAIKPTIPAKKNNPKFHTPRQFHNNRLFSVLSILSYLLSAISPKSRWRNRVIDLIETKHSAIPIRWMGFPENWRDYEFWERKDD